MAWILPHSQVTPIPDTSPPAVPSLWNDRYDEIDANFKALAEASNFCECASEGDKSEKSAELQNFALTKFSRVLVRFANENSAENVTLNISGTGAKPIYVGLEPMQTEGIRAGRIYEFLYDGEHWVLLSGGAGSGADMALLSPDPVEIFNSKYGESSGDIIGSLVVDATPVKPDPTDTFENTLTE